KFGNLLINTNGFVAFEVPPPQAEYLGKMPAPFKMVAVLLGDLDNSDGRGSVYFRISGKLSGRLFVGRSSSAEELGDADLHSYVVAKEGRTYVAVSSVGASLGPALRLLPVLGGVIGWAFALEQPGYRNGFSIAGGEFWRQAEAVFLPGGQRLSVRQRFSGLDQHGHLVLHTHLEGRLPAVPPGSSVQISPYQEVYRYHRSLISSSSSRGFTITHPDGTVQNRTCQWHQNIVFESCPHDDHAHVAPPTQQLSVDQIFVMFDPENELIRFAMSTRTGPVQGGPPPEQNPCSSGTHGCDLHAVCTPGDGDLYACQCAAGFTGDGRRCDDIDECAETPPICGSASACTNQPGTFRCLCAAGFTQGEACADGSPPEDRCQTGRHDCDVPERASCSAGGSAYTCSCLPGFVGDGRACRDDDECLQGRCHLNATCSNTPGSYACRCGPGFHGDGFRCSPSDGGVLCPSCCCWRSGAQASSAAPGEAVITAGCAHTPAFTALEAHSCLPCPNLSASFLPERSCCGRSLTPSCFPFPERQKSACERHRAVLGQYVPRCDAHGAYESTQCHASIGQCWCVDATGREIPNTRTGPGSTPLCIERTVMPTPVGPTPRPDVQPVAAGTHLLFARSGRIERVPLDGYRMKTEEAGPLLHIPDRVVVAVAFDCVEKTVYWSDITAPAISRARLGGGHVSAIVTQDLGSPEGLALDHVSRLLFWTDSLRDTVEVSKLDGSQRRVLFHTELVNPRAIVTNPVHGRLYWADWDRDGPKIETSNMDGTGRSVLVKDDLGLPNGLTFDLHSQQLCWADAGTRKVECMDPHRRSRTLVVEGVQYPFALVSFGRNLYYTDWRR
uniref:Nidogen 1 n=1 Tax=Tetraodon nigroviridis TaxID=99883 RepID=H3CGM1_TETNG